MLPKVIIFFLFHRFQLLLVRYLISISRIHEIN